MNKKIVKTLFYLIIYSFFGYCLESIVAIVTKGVIESRQSFVYGPFCVIYGIGAIILISILSNFKNQNFKLFFLGMFIGCSVEYLGSFIGEKLLGFAWWNYSNMFFNINGRTSLFYAICWGIISIFLINFINPNIDKLFEKLIALLTFPKLQLATYILALFFLFDALLSGFALNNFYNNTIHANNIGTPFELAYLEDFHNTFKNSDFSNFINKTFTNEKMIKIYPNILLPTISGIYINVDSLLNNAQTYYLKVFGNL